MSTRADRLELCEGILALIEKKRRSTGDDSLGAAIEDVILNSEFQELETEILDNPGAFEPWLVRRKPLN